MSKEELYPIYHLTCPKCGASVHRDSGDIHNHEYTCETCSTFFVISKDKKKHVVEVPYIYNLVGGVSFLLAIVLPILSWIVGVENILLITLPSLVLVNVMVAVELLSGYRHGVITIKSAVYRFQSPLVFNVCMVSLLVFILTVDLALGYMLYLS